MIIMIAALSLSNFLHGDTVSLHHMSTCNSSPSQTATLLSLPRAQSTINSVIPKGQRVHRTPVHQQGREVLARLVHVGAGRSSIIACLQHVVQHEGIDVTEALLRMHLVRRAVFAPQHLRASANGAIERAYGVDVNGVWQSIAIVARQHLLQHLVHGHLRVVVGQLAAIQQRLGTPRHARRIESSRALSHQLRVVFRNLVQLAKLQQRGVHIIHVSHQRHQIQALLCLIGQLAFVSGGVQVALVLHGRRSRRVAQLVVDKA
mmetsp:Transcript_1755/g.3309  ORF Transcript_1755/g.3309 Transcript_1755/m.3309 type:complete len:261 (+) Transcript_1755:127-909(+)